MKELLKRFVRNEKGLETVEWAIMAALIILGLVALITSLRDEMGNVFTGVQTELQNADATP